MITVAPYTPALRREWDDMVMHSRNGTLLHLRGYMDYHADRFCDASLIARNHRGGIVAMLPANIEDGGKCVCSHRGLTFGGCITPARHFDAGTMLEVMTAFAEHYRANGVRQLIYKPIPWIYPVMPADDDIYALFRLGPAMMTGCNVSTAIQLSAPPLLNESTRQDLKRCRALGIKIAESDNFEQFWQMLSRVLDERHNAVPTHTVDEMRLLHSRFPDRIRLLSAVMPDGDTVAGAVVYIDRNVIHTQYMATTQRGREVKALVPLICTIPQFGWADGRAYLDFGSSCEQGGQILNRGLLLQKSGLGGRSVACCQYTLTL